MNKSKRRAQVLYLVIVTFVIGLAMACTKNLPDPYLSFGSDMLFTQKTYKPTLGRNTLFSDNFSAGSSSLPLDFKIVNLTRHNGEPAPELMGYYPVLVWKSPYLGNEESLEEIEAKRVFENHQLFEIRKHSGQFLVWSAANSNFIKAQPDSGYVFDVEVSNSGGRKYFQDFRLIPTREVEYEPNPNGYDPVTGQAVSTVIAPSSVSNIRGATTGSKLEASDIRILMERANKDDQALIPPYEGAYSLKIKVVDSLFNPIDLNKFNTTDWKNLVHGFDMKFMNDSVIYKVAYPIPLTNIPTRYTTGDGNSARTTISYTRQGFGNIKEDAFFSFDFKIFEPGDWVITFRFIDEIPKFDND